MRLEGKTALVTGASHGLGKATALLFAREGADVAITYRGREDGARETAVKIASMGRRAQVIHAEMTERDDCYRAVDETISAFGRLDILVNNAGGGRSTALLDQTPEDWQYTLALCVTAPFLCGQRAARHMIERGGGGAMVNISSVHSANAWPNDAAYGVAKAGLNRLTKSMAVEWARHGIRVNCIAPGYIEVAVTPEEQEKYALEKTHAEPAIPAQRTGKPDEIAFAALYLASDEAAYTTGQTLFVDGGLLLPPLTVADYMRGDRTGGGLAG